MSSVRVSRSVWRVSFFAIGKSLSHPMDALRRCPRILTADGSTDLSFGCHALDDVEEHVLERGSTLGAFDVEAAARIHARTSAPSDRCCASTTCTAVPKMLVFSTSGRSSSSRITSTGLRRLHLDDRARERRRP